MGLSIRGDFDALKELDKRLDWFAGNAIRHELNQHIAAAQLSVLHREFESSTDPYGSAWKPLKRRKGQPLLDTGRLRSSFGVADVTPYGYVLGSSVDYAAPHQYGAVINRKARVQPRMAKGGRFVSKARASSSSRTKTRVTYLSGGQHVLPQRQMLPEGEWGPRWWDAIAREVDKTVRDTFGG